MFCHQCGAKLPDGAAFCSNCGAAQSFSSTSAPTESPVSPISPKPQKQSRHKGILAAVIGAVVIVAAIILIPSMMDSLFGSPMQPSNTTVDASDYSDLDAQQDSTPASGLPDEDDTDAAPEVSPDNSDTAATEGTSSSGSTTSQSRELVAEPLTTASVEPNGPAIMALEYYSSDLRVGASDTSGDALVRKIEGDSSTYKILQAYVDLLCESYDFAQVESPYYNTLKDTFFEFNLDYTGSGSLSGDKIEGTYTDYRCDVMIYGIIEGGSLEGAIWYSDDLIAYDGGYRYGESASGKDLVGTSATAGLYRLGDGSFLTDDGLLQASLGQAMMVSDSETTTCSARMLLNESSSHQEIWVENASGGALLEFYFPLSWTLSAGQIYTEETFIIESSYAVSDKGRFSEMPQYTWSNMFAIYHGNNYLVPITAMGGDLKRVNVRVMYAEGNEYVFHVCAQFSNSPKEVELLIAVTPEAAAAETLNQSSSSGSWCSACGGSGDCSNCGGSDRVYKTLAGTTERVEQDCTSCRPAGSGHCPFCGGSGQE